MKHFGHLIILSAVLISCNNSKVGQADHIPASKPINGNIKDMSWLAGKWQNRSADGIAFENWEADSDSVMQGAGGFINGNDTMVSETIVLKQSGSGVEYIPTVKDQNNGQPIPFKLIIADHDSFVFENPEHDFPQRITYIKSSDHALLAKISGTIDGQAHTESFPMERVK